MSMEDSYTFNTVSVQPKLDTYANSSRYKLRLGVLQDHSRNPLNSNSLTVQREIIPQISIPTFSPLFMSPMMS